MTDWCSHRGRSLTTRDAGVGTPTALTILPIDATAVEPPNNEITVEPTRQMRQSRLDNRTFNNNDPWGDRITSPPTKSVRIGFRNIKFFPASIKDDRNDALRKDIVNAHIDIIGLSEINIAWQHLDYISQPQSRFRSKFEQSKWICANNQNDNEGVPVQRGGTMLGTINHASNRVIEMGTDSRSLGRWCWCLLQGKDNMLLVCTVYRSCGGSRGATTSYSQQKGVLMRAGITNCPRAQFWEDLAEEIKQWNDMGHHIVIGGDFNDPITATSVKTFFANFGMREAILHKLGPVAPNTYRDGTVPIDGIFCTASLEITAAGYTPIFWGMATDHRLIWIDISLESAFGKNSNVFQPPSARKLQLDQPNIVDQYLGHRIQLMKKNQLEERTNALYEKVFSGQKGLAIILELEKLDRLRTSDMLVAESRCRKIKTGGVAWSPILQKSVEILRYLRLVLSSFKTNINKRTLYKAYQSTTLDTKVHTVERAVELLQAEKATYKAVKLGATAVRKSFLDQLAEQKAAESGLEASTVLKQLQLRENQRNLARQLHRIKGTTKRGLNVMEVLQEDEWKMVTEKTAIEMECLREGKKRFSQAINTPSLTKDQIDLLGWTANTEASTQILQGTIPITLHQDLVHIAAYLQQPATVSERPMIESIMTPEQYAAGWAKARERTASGISGLHFGHFKANSRLQATLDIDVKILQMTIHLGYSLLRWKSAVDVMIPKKADSKRAEQLRVICLMEPDFNFMNKWMGKITMANAEASNTIADEQFGSRKNKSAIQHALNKALCFDTLRAMKQDSSLTVLDAKSCYDRIPPPLACLCLRRQGLPQNIIDSSFNSIKDMTHHIRTAYGISNDTYERDEDSFIHGILQGNGAGPCIWVMLSSPILDMLSHTGNGAVLNLGNGETVKVVAFAFVDDIDLIQKLPKENPLAALQHDFDIWNKGLQTASGALVWEKCDVYILQYLWNGRLHSWTLADQEYCPDGSINIIDNGITRPITRKDPSEATLSLGVMFAPSGSMKDQVERLRANAEAWADLLRVKRSSSEAVWYSLTASIMKSIEYPLLATSMSQSDFQYIMAPILLSALPRAKICRYMSRAVLYSLPMHHGMGLTNPYYTQGMRKLIELMHERSPKNPSAKFLQAATEAMEICTGLGPNYLSIPINKLMIKTIDNSILRCLWEFLTEYKIILTNLRDPHLQFPQDKHIMYRVFHSHFKPKEVATFQYCRLYLQIEKVSEIITTDGSSIQRHIWHGQQLQHTLHRRVWPDQPCPTTSAWTLFRKMLRTIFLTSEHGVFATAITVNGWVRRHWKWFYCEKTLRLYEATSHNTGVVRTGANTSSRRTRRNPYMFWKHSIEQGSIPNSAIPVTVYENHGFIHIEKYTKIHNYVSHSIHTRWSDYHSVKLNVHRETMDQAFLQGDLVLVSDGSYKEGVGSAAWILASTRTYKTFASGQCPTTGPPTAQDSHRSELFGILGGLLFLKRYLSKFRFQAKHPILVGLDNTSAMHYVFDHNRYPVVKSYFPDFDTIMSARSLLHPMIQYNYVHIEGHQDENFIGPLLYLPMLNIQMDTSCKAFRGTVTQDLSQAILPNQQFKLNFQQHMICKQIDITLKEGISAHTMGLYWDRHQEISLNAFPMVSWQAVGMAMKRETPLKQHWIVKHATGTCGVNATLVDWKEKTSVECVRCRARENAGHVWKCQHHSSSTIWDNALIELEIWMENHFTSPHIIQALILGLHNWYKGKPGTRGCLLTSAQQSIGWQHVITGKFHIHWLEVQQQHFLQTGRGKKSSIRWLAQLISRIWKIAWDLWEKRNEYEHENDQLHKHQEYSMRIAQEIAYGYEDLHESCHYCFADREITHLRTIATVEYKRQWIALVASARIAETSAILPSNMLPIAPLPI